MLPHTDYVHLQRCRHCNDFSSNAPKTDHNQICPTDFEKTRLFIPDRFHCPLAALLITRCGRQPLGQSKQHGNCMLRHHRPVYASGIRQSDIA